MKPCGVLIEKYWAYSEITKAHPVLERLSHLLNGSFADPGRLTG